MTYDSRRPCSEPLQLRSAPRCGARTRKGAACQSPVVHGRARCRMHGGAYGSGGPRGERNGNYRHGHFSSDNLEQRRSLRALMREAREILTKIEV
jgi:hypothetical protein